MISIKKALSVIAIFSLVFSPVTPAFAVDYDTAGNPNLLLADPGAVVNLVNTGATTIVTINGGVDLANPAGVTTAVNGDGQLILTGPTTITGPIGVAGSRLGELEAQTATVGVLNGITYANVVDLQGAATLDVNANLFASTGVSFASGATGSITFTAADMTGTINPTADGEGKVIIDGATTFNNALGTNAGLSLGELEVQNAGVGVLSAASFIDLVDLQGAGTLDVNADLTSSTGVSFAAAASGSITYTTSAYTGTISTVTDGGGKVISDGTNSFSGAVGANAGASIGELEVQNTGASTLNAASFIDLVDLQGAGTLDVNADLTSSTGVSFAAAASGSITYTTSAYTGTISTVTDGGGKVISDGTNSFSGAVGANAGASIGELEVQNAGRSTLNAASFIDVVDLQGAGTLDVNADLTSSTGVSFAAAASGSITYTTSAYTGTISTVTDGGGKVISDGTNSFSGAVGANAGASIGELEVQNAGRSTLSSASFIDLVDLQGAGTLDVNADLTSSTGVSFAAAASGSITYTTSAYTGTISTVTDGGGKVISDGVNSFSGAVGASAAASIGELEIQNAGRSTLSSASFIDLVDIQGAGTLTVDGNLTTGTTAGTNGIIFAAASTGVVTVADGVSITGVIDGTGGAVGTVTYEGASTIGSLIGSSQAIAAINIGDTVTGGIVTLGNNIAATTTTVNTGATLYANGNRTITGDLAVANAASATVSLDTNTLTVTGTYTMLAAGQINLDLNSNTLALGNIAATGIATIPATVGVDVDVLGTGYIADGQTFNAVTGGAGGAVAGGNTVTDDNPYVSFTTTGGDNLVLVASRSGTSFNNFTTTGNATAAAQALEAAGKAGATGDMKTVLDALESLPTSGIQSAVATMTPDVSSGAMNASQQTATQFMGSVSNRLGYARDGLTGVSTGDMLQGTGFWIQGLGSNLNQGTRKGIEGYSANLFGTTIGADHLVDEHIRVGLAGGYGFADVNSKTPGSPQDDINSWSGIIYGSYDSMNLCQARQSKKNSRLAVRNQLKDNWYVDGMFGFTQYNYDSRREIWLTPATQRIAKADHHGQSYTTKMEGGYTFVFEATKNLETTPFAALQYSYLRMNKYKEHGADALNLTVNGAGYNQLLQTLGAKFAYPIVSKKAGTFIPMLKCAWLFDYIADRFETNASFAGGGTSFETRGAKPARNGILIGSELGYLNKGNMTLTANYDLELKDEFVGNTYYATARFDF